tara:strand:+ start:19 stop:444 length:426 start_codon:yes stop_codon:yes gene_type:complete
MDQIDKINRETKEISELTFKELNNQGESLKRTNQHLNIIDNNLNISKVLIDNMTSINNRIYNYFFKKPVKNELPLDDIQIDNEHNIESDDKCDTIYQQIIDIKNINLNINHELSQQNEILEDIYNQSEIVSNKLNKLNKRI